MAEKQLTWGELRKRAEHLPDSAPVYVVDGDFNCIEAESATIYTHKSLNSENLNLIEEDLAQSDKKGFEVEKLPEAVLGIAFGELIDFLNVSIPSIA